MSRELRVVDIKTRKVVHRVPITGDKNDRQVAKIMLGMIHHIDDDKFLVEDSADDAKPKRKS